MHLTFSGLGLREAAYVVLLTGLSSSPDLIVPIALTFALLVRLIAVTTDLIGLPPLLKTSTGLLTNFRNRAQKEQCPKIDGISDEVAASS